MNPIAEKRLHEHEAGWLVLEAGEPIAELTFIRIDPPCYRFRLIPLVDEGRVRRILEGSAFRDPNPAVVFKSKQHPELVVEDGFFFTGMNPDYLSLRDMRSF